MRACCFSVPDGGTEQGRTGRVSWMLCGIWSGCMSVLCAGWMMEDGRGLVQGPEEAMGLSRSSGVEESVCFSMERAGRGS